MVNLESGWKEKFPYPDSLKDEEFQQYFITLDRDSKDVVIEALSDIEWEHIKDRLGKGSLTKTEGDQVLIDLAAASSEFFKAVDPRK